MAAAVPHGADRIRLTGLPAGVRAFVRHHPSIESPRGRSAIAADDGGLKEFVYVLKRRDLFEQSGPVEGFRPHDPAELERLYLRRIRERGFFVERGHAERDPDFKQIIPYTVV